MNYTIQELRDKNLIIFETISGSIAYGTNTPESDVDIRGVFVQPLEDALKYGFIEQVSDEKNDIVFYELGRFMKLLSDNNPNIIELISMPDDCIIFKHPMFKKVIEDSKEQFITKRVRWTFSQYAISQINKAKGYNKKINWEEEKIRRKNVLDFCYVLVDGGSQPFKEWIENLYLQTNIKYNQKDIGLVNVDHTHNIYAMYISPNREEYGIVSDEDKSNEVQLTSIPKGHNPIGYMSFNSESYSIHCREYREYQEWIKNRNENRFKMNKEHGKNYDSKNMCHTFRLLMISLELSKGELRVRRTPEEIDKLMKIRKGEYEYDDLIKEADKMKDLLDDAFEKSTLPNKIDNEMVLSKLFELRKYFYKI